MNATTHLHLRPIPALADNYIWMLHDDLGNALVVDPGEATPVLDALQSRQLQLRAILLTHHHADHIGGSAHLHALTAASIHAPDDPRIKLATHRVKDGDRIELGAPQCAFEVLAVPGHTLSHVAFYGEGLLFCGDTLFSVGCGRLFEGTPAQMLASLQRLAALPAHTQVCCGHEYTLANGAFAQSIEPANVMLRQRLQAVRCKRQLACPACPRECPTNSPATRSCASMKRMSSMRSPTKWMSLPIVSPGLPHCVA